MKQIFAIVCAAFFVITNAGPAPKLTSLKITGCFCNNVRHIVCTYDQVGYASQFGSYINIVATISSGSVACADTPVTGFGSIVTGYRGTCTATTDSGIFTIKDPGAGLHLVGTNYDTVNINNCIADPPRSAILG